MRSVWKVHRWLLLCKRVTSPEETHTDTELQNHTPGPIHGPPSPIPTNPQHLNDVVASKYHRRKTLFFPGRSVSSLHLLPTPQVGIKHHGASQTRAREKAPPSSTKLFLSRRKIPEYLQCSLSASYSCDEREEKNMRLSASWVPCIQVFCSLFVLRKPNGSVVESIAPKENIEDFCRKGWSFSWKISQAHFDQQLKIFISIKNIFCRENYSWLQFLIYVVILKKCPFELFIFWERLNIHPLN